MEITLQKENISLYETVWRKNTDAVAEADSIVPDTKPDIARILKTAGRAKVLGKEMLGDKISIRGEAVYTVLYVPENGEEQVEAMEVRIPFKDICSAGTEAESAEVFADAEVGETECMLLNSRKIALKGKIYISMEAVRKKEAALSTGVEAELPMETKTKTVRFAAPAGRGRYTVTAADTLEVPAENPPVREILHTEAYLGEENVKLITGKIILKGTVRLKTLYLSSVPSYPLCTMEHEIPFTEILDMPSCEEGMPYMLDYEITDIYWETDDDGEGAREFGAEVTMAVVAKTVLEKDMEILDDCFCPGYVTELKYESVGTETPVDVICEEISVRKTLSLPMDFPPIEEVCALFAKPEVTAVSVLDGAVETEGHATVHLIYRAADGADTVVSYTDKIPFSFSAPAKAGEKTEIAVRTRQGGATYTLSDSSSVDVRVLAGFDIRLSEKGEMLSVSDILLKEEEKEKKPSVIIAFTEKDDTLWSLAKKYGVPTEKIAAANDLGDTPMIKEGMRLVVPRG